jgi:uncharacterized lipoprotein YmbA
VTLNRPNRLSVLSYLVAGAVLVIAGCGTSPEPAYYALSPSVGQASGQAPAGIKTIQLRRPGLAGYLDRPEIVRRLVDSRLGVAANERWGEPLNVMIGRVVAQDMAQRLGGISVFTEDGAITADADATVEIDIQKFEMDGGGSVQLVAQLAIERGTSHAATGAKVIRLSARPEVGTTSGMVQAMSTLLGQMSDQVAAAVRGT